MYKRQSVECSALLFIAVLMFASDKITNSGLVGSVDICRSELTGAINEQMYGTLFFLINKLK